MTKSGSTITPDTLQTITSNSQFKTKLLFLFSGHTIMNITFLSYKATLPTQIPRRDTLFFPTDMLRMLNKCIIWGPGSKRQTRSKGTRKVTLYNLHAQKNVQSMQQFTWPLTFLLKVTDVVYTEQWKSAHENQSHLTLCGHHTDSTASDARMTYQVWPNAIQIENPGPDSCSESSTQQNTLILFSSKFIKQSRSVIEGVQIQNHRTCGLECCSLTTHHLYNKELLT